MKQLMVNVYRRACYKRMEYHGLRYGEHVEEWNVIL